MNGGRNNLPKLYEVVLSISACDWDLKRLLRRCWIGRQRHRAAKYFVLRDDRSRRNKWNGLYADARWLRSISNSSLGDFKSLFSSLSSSSDSNKAVWYKHVWGFGVASLNDNSLTGAFKMEQFWRNQCKCLALASHQNKFIYVADAISIIILLLILLPDICCCLNIEHDQYAHVHLAVIVLYVIV